MFHIEQQPTAFGPDPIFNLIGSMPHLAAEENWTTTFTFINKSAASAQAQFSLFAENGNPLLLPLVFPQQPSTDGTLLGATLEPDTAAECLSGYQYGWSQPHLRCRSAPRRLPLLEVWTDSPFSTRS